VITLDCLHVIHLFALYLESILCEFLVDFSVSMLIYTQNYNIYCTEDGFMLQYWQKIDINM